MWRSERLLVLWLLAAAPEIAQAGEWGWFLSKLGGDAVPYRWHLSEQRAPSLRLTAASIYDGHPLQDRESVPGMDLSVGTLVPLVSWSSTEPRWALGAGVDVGFHMLWDLESDSRPIVNTDYRFSKAPVVFIRRQLNQSDVREWFVGLRVSPYLHESSHLGDELVVQASRRVPEVPFTRVDVSKDVFQVTAQVTSDGVSDEWSFQIGGEWPWEGLWTSTAYVTESFDEMADPPSTVSVDAELAASDGDATWFVGAEYGRIVGESETWEWRVSADLRFRPLYVYRTDRATVDLDRKASINVVASYGRSQNWRGLAQPYLFLRYYHGVHPHGQLRDQADFDLVGVGVGLR